MTLKRKKDDINNGERGLREEIYMEKVETAQADIEINKMELSRRKKERMTVRNFVVRKLKPQKTDAKVINDATHSV